MYLLPWYHNNLRYSSSLIHRLLFALTLVSISFRKAMSLPINTAARKAAASTSKSFGAAGNCGESRPGRFETYLPKRLVLQPHHNPDISYGNTERGPRPVPLFHIGHI
ncbi:hypothetical protein ASPFODRAFT_53233 [Aspergillus luchuensis CBS 106.47]|uniref:Uncharacterized protein n=1 Tax=Aspergillus luchuensis (strain CBS 106.47) TaxID=1137211 RepID=A0A1M3T108_ASPLC|nr:hypothetical protein ASPFODRAFT_53233 [Aspergillus luchuensis CBS 106.47]